MKQKLTGLEIQMDKPTIIVRDFNIPLSANDRSTIYKISKGIEGNRTTP